MPVPANSQSKNHTEYDSQVPMESSEEEEDILSDSELDIAEVTINEVFEKDVRINFSNFLASKTSGSYREFKNFERIWKDGNNPPLHKPIPGGVELSVQQRTLTDLFGVDAKFIPFITNFELEYFRLSVLRHFNVSHCSCGCTWITLEVNKPFGGRQRLCEFRNAVAELACHKHESSKHLSVRTRQRLQAAASIAEQEREEEQFKIDLAKAEEEEFKKESNAGRSAATIRAIARCRIDPIICEEELQHMAEVCGLDKTVEEVNLLSGGPKTPPEDVHQVEETKDEDFFKQKYINDSQVFE